MSPTTLVIHEMPADVFDAWEKALGAVPTTVSIHHHEAGAYLDRPVGSLIFENERYTPASDGTALFVRGMAFRRGPA